jgi:catalase
LEEFLDAHPAAKEFVAAPKPTPSSFAREAYWGINAFKFVNKDGKEIYFRYKIDPDAGMDGISPSELEKQGPNFLHEEINRRLGTHPVTFTLRAQLAEEGDILNDATVRWPEGRRVVALGSIKLDKVVEDSGGPEQKKIIFDPIPRVEGLGVSDDPILALRDALYLISGSQRRRAALT